MGGAAKLFHHTRLLIWKNFVIKSRNLRGSFAEIILPIAVGLFLVWVRSLIDVTTVSKNLKARYDPNEPVGNGVNDLITGYCPSWRFSPDNLLVIEDSVAGNAFGTFLTQDRSPNHYCISPDSVVYLASEKALEDAIKDSQYKGIYEAAIFFDAAGPKVWKYTIRMSRNQIPSTDFDVEPFERNIENTDYLLQYADWSGFTSLQRLVDEWIITTSLSESVLPTDYLMYSYNDFPYDTYEDDEFFVILQNVFVLFVLLTFLWPFTRMVKFIMEEKEKRLREGMRMMGLSHLSFWLSWGLTYLIMYTFISLVLGFIFTTYIMKNSTFLANFVYFWSFLVASIGLAFLFSTVFSSSKTAVNIAVFFYIGGYFMYIAFDDRDTTSTEVQSICLFAPACFCYSTRTMSLWEQSLNNEGINNSTWWKEAYNISFGQATSLLFADFAIYLLLAWYCDKVIPGDVGVPLPWYFVVDPRYWFPKVFVKTHEHVRASSAGGIDPMNFQEFHSDRPGIEVDRLRKTFGSFVAVDDVCLSMPEGEVFVLLGHNGAGKSTTISMLTGLIPIDGGDAEIYGDSIKYDLDNVQQRIGVCPQHNVLFDNMTVKEHLQLFCSIKSVPFAQREDMIRDGIAEVGLTEKTDALSSTLSGGQKRKLCVAIAFIGNPQVVFLDEPTSGMDPNSRRDTWATIKKYKENKVIILTTHFMDEADILGDRIAIMSHGKVVCLGTSLFLKARFGVGYTFVVSKSEDTHGDSHLFIETMRKHLEEFEIINDIGNEIFFRIPFTQSIHFPALFREMDDNRASLGIRNFAISVTTLEEVFLKVGSGDTAAVEHQKPGKNSLGNESSDPQDKTTDAQRIADLMEKSGAGNTNHSVYLWFKHFYALILKRFHYAKRDPAPPLLMIVLPLLFMVIGYTVVGLIPTQFRSLKYSISRYDTPVPVPVYNNAESTVAVYDDITSAAQIFELDSYLDTVSLPFQEPFGPYSANFKAYVTLFRANVSQEILNSVADHKKSMYGAYVDVSNIQGLSNSNWTFWIYANQTGLHAGPTFTNALSDALLKYVNNDASFSIETSVHPFPLDQDELEQAQSIEGFVLSIFIGLSFIFVPGNFVSFLVMEKSTKAKHLQMISGVSVLIYWFSNYVWDFITYLVLFGLSVLLLAYYGTEALTGSNFFLTCLLFLLFGLATISFSYLMSFLFDEVQSARTLSIMISLLTGIILFVVYVALSAVPSTKDVTSELEFLFRFFPGYCLNDALISISLNNAQEDPDDPYKNDIAGNDLWYLAFQAPIYLAITILLEYALSVPKIAYFLRKLFMLEPSSGFEQYQEDEDVKYERERIQNDSEKDNIVRLKGIRKVYQGHNGRKVAVKDMWFSIPKGECFGFLGINGAGKTTTLKILSGDIIPTSGTATMDGYDILNEQLQVRRLIGYCPQFDAIFDKLTAREHLKLFARIKGVAEADLDEIVTGMIKYLSLTQYTNKIAGTYSGGNKRKLSVAISLIGDPPIVFLDEPSTGMDPVSRRFMWKFISETMEHRAVILTTHSMEECEALCNRMGIMVDGALSCIGTPQHLKNRFGKGFQLDVRTSPGNVEHLLSQIAETFVEPELLEVHEGSIKYRIPQLPNQALADIFEVIEQNKEEFGVLEYSVSQTSLEQIFIFFAKQQNASK